MEPMTMEEVQKNDGGLVERRREQIITVARRIFARKGYQSTTTDDIIAELGVGKGTLYRYFKDKKELFLAVDDEGFERLELSAATAYAIEDPRARLKALVRVFFEFFDSDRDLVEIHMQMRSEFRGEYERRFSEGRDRNLQRVANLVREGTARGYFHAVDPTSAAKSISALLYGTLLMFHDTGMGGRLSDYIQPTTGFVMSGLSKRGDEPQVSE
jgi:AcrR family transcriptional regulator